MCYGRINHYFVHLNRSRVLRIRKVILPNTNPSGNPGGLTFRMSRIHPLLPPLWSKPPTLLPEISQLWPTPHPVSIPTTAARLILLEHKSDHITLYSKPSNDSLGSVLVMATWAYTIWTPLLLALLQTCQTHSCRRAFALAIPLTS